MCVDIALPPDLTGDGTDEWHDKQHQEQHEDLEGTTQITWWHEKLHEDLENNHLGDDVPVLRSVWSLPDWMI